MTLINTQELKDLVHQSSSVVAHYWPMTTFVHHNPIRSLEGLPFHEAVSTARQFIGGRGYLTNETYRKLVKSGRISVDDINLALERIVTNDEVLVGSRKIGHLEVLRAHLLHGITPPYLGSVEAFVAQLPNRALINALAKGLVLESELQEKSSQLCRNTTLSAWCDRTFNTHIVWLINRELIKWCEAFMDEGQATWPMPERDRGFYSAWKILASKELSPCGISKSRRKIRALPASAEEALAQHLEALAIPPELQKDYLSLELTALCGWASFINWRSENDDYNWQAAYPIDLVQYLAVRLFYERELVDQVCKRELGISGHYENLQLHVDKIKSKSGSEETDENQAAKLAAAWRLTELLDALQIPQAELSAANSDALQQLLSWLDDFSEDQHGPLWLNAYEAGYHKELLNDIKKNSGRDCDDSDLMQRPDVQMMFCIDVRSEPFRRHLEAAGNNQTLGFAGFFGLPISCRALDHTHETAQCPAIAKPKFVIHEVVREGQETEFSLHKEGKDVFHLAHEIIHDLKHHILSPYIYVESLGWLSFISLVERTFFPGIYRKWKEFLTREIIVPVGTRMTAQADNLGRGLSDDDQNQSIETALRTIGLTQNFARLVVIAGHASLSDNNPFEAALNCGACGGNSGESNARLFATIANNPKVRHYLAQKGITIPEDTYFMGAVHNTTTDVVELYDLEDLPSSHKQDVEQIKASLRLAALHTNQERCNRLPNAGKNLSLEAAAKEVRRRSGDWSETRPEWGLSGNACYIIGKRTLTSKINLKGRSFLNSYDYRQDDSSSSLLEGILMAPMIVGQWINAEHYFSATDPDIYGSGSKIYHNIVGRVGIMSGPQSDLRTGLAWQSVAIGDMTYHEPLRLSVIVEAPQNRILDIVNRQPELKKLCDNEWIHLFCVDYTNINKFFHYRPQQDWIEVKF